MDLRDFYQIILRNLAVVLTLTVAGIGTAFGVTSLMTPIYEAKTQLFVTTPSASVDLSAVIQGSSFSQQRVKSYAQIINGPSTLLPVIRKLELDISVDELAKRVKASAPLDTVLINVTVRDEQPRMAAAIANAIGEEFSKTVNQLELANAKKESPIKVTVVKTATSPKNPSSPRLYLNLLLGLILGAGLGIGVGIVRQIFDNTVKKESDLGEVPLLGAIGFDNDAKNKPLITQIGRYHPRTEAFRQLRTNIQYLKSDDPNKLIAITSALPEEGKTTTSINLAMSFAQSGKKVILIEADMRRPKSENYLRIEKSNTGLSSLLVKQNTLENFDLTNSIISLKNEKIDLLPCGPIPPNPAEILLSPRFDELLKLLSEAYDYVFIDCPPSIPIADASIIATKVNGTLIVVRAGVTQIKQFLGVKESVLNVDAQVLGVVLNMIPKSRAYSDYGYTYGYSYSNYRAYGNYAPTNLGDSNFDVPVKENYVNLRPKRAINNPDQLDDSLNQ